MATTEDIERRVEEADAARSAKRSAAAQRVGQLASRRAEIAEQLGNIERELGDVVMESSDVIEIGELSTFTDVPVADLTRWLESRRTVRPKRKKSTGGSPNTKKVANQKPAAPRAPTKGSTPQDPFPTRDGATNPAAEMR
ncbi:hypothetical protein DI005_22205 [Prauserella sp. PE36]|uniref:hypothetical protein n=1 Tax=Prauserella sp. PE36 TaxID=1504709 RepID=UPI000DE46EA0|nr:hypothetical protein [Prauserella sp. PE36]RBM17405.1 hypothetical protein DI005_22205 [Prauserella sp. PE36]